MQKSTSTIKTSLVEMDAYTSQEKELAPPPYPSDQDTLPSYTESTPLTEIEIVLTRFAPRLDDQRVHHTFDTDIRDPSSPSNSKVGHLLDRMEAYRYKDQEWSSHNQIKMRQLAKNMYNTQRKSSSGASDYRKIPCLSSAKSKYQKITLTIAKEREHLIHQMKKIRSSSPSCTEELDVFLDSVYVSSSQLRMSNQCATRLVPTV